MVLPALVSEFRLEKQIVSLDDAGAVGGCQRFSNSRLEVVAALVGGINGAKSGAQRQFRQTGCAVFFPGRAV